jgi:hypothetical protein
VIRARWAARARAVRAVTLARVILGLLVIASVAALFYAQLLKRRDPLVLHHGGVTTFQPSGPDVKQAHIHITVTVNDVLDVTVRSARTNRQVAVLARNFHDREYKRFELAWDGRTAAGALAPAGDYLVAVRFAKAGQTVVVPNFQLHLKGRSG